MNRVKEGMSPNYDNSFPRQNKSETLDDAGSTEGGLELSQGFSLQNTEWHVAKAKELLEDIERAIDHILENS